MKLKYWPLLRRCLIEHIILVLMILFAISYLNLKRENEFSV